MMELAAAIPLDGHDYSNFRTAVGKLIFKALGRPDMQLAIQQLSTQVFNLTTESKPAVKQLIRCLKGRHNICLRLEPLVTQIGPEIRQRAKASRDINVHGVTMRNQRLKQFLRSRELVLRSQCLRELLGLADFKELHCNVSVHLEMDSDAARHTLQRRTGRTQAH